MLQTLNILETGNGVRYNYSSAFAIMMRRIGLNCFPVYCHAKSGDSYSGHMITFITLGGVDFVFDPDIDDSIAGYYGYCTYDRYGKILAELGDQYKDSRNPEKCCRIFGEFRYDDEAMPEILKK